MNNNSDILKIAYQDSILEDTFVAPTIPSARNKAQLKVLLIGGTGVVGPGVIYNYLIHNHAVTVMIRGDKETEKNRLIEQLSILPEYHEIKELCITNLSVISGDLAKDNLDLNNNDKQIFLNADVIWHVAAWTNHIRPYTTFDSTKPDIRQTNTLCVKRILQLIMESGRNIPYNFVSTVPAAKLKAHQLTEEFVPEMDIVNNTGYIMSKKVSEHILLQATNRGFDIGVYRLGYVIGHSKTGALCLAHRVDHLMAEIFAVINTGFYPNWGMVRKNVLSYDIVGKIFYNINQNFNHKNRVYNIVNPVAAKWDDIIGGLKQNGFSNILPIDNKEFIQLVLDKQLDLAKFVKDLNYPNINELGETLKHLETESNIAMDNMLNTSSTNPKEIPSSLGIIINNVSYLFKLSRQIL